jgi:hypothetical protein
MKVKAYAAACAVIAGIAAPGQSGAQVQFPVSMPASQVGEVAKYRTIDLWNNKELSTAETEIVELQPDRIVSRSKRSDQAGTRTTLTTREWQPCRNMQNSDKMVCAGSFKFPMELGARHKYENLPWPNGTGHSSGDCEVKAEEKVTVPAGNFDAVRIECSGYWNRVFGGTFTGRQVETIWYAPKISRMVKFQFTDYYSSGGGVFNKTLTELTEFAGK